MGPTAAILERGGERGQQQPGSPGIQVVTPLAVARLGKIHRRGAALSYRVCVSRGPLLYILSLDYIAFT